MHINSEISPLPPKNIQKQKHIAGNKYCIFSKGNIVNFDHTATNQLVLIDNDCKTSLALNTFLFEESLASKADKWYENLSF